MTQEAAGVKILDPLCSLVQQQGLGGVASQTAYLWCGVGADPTPASTCPYILVADYLVILDQNLDLVYNIMASGGHSHPHVDQLLLLCTN